MYAGGLVKPAKGKLQLMFNERVLKKYPADIRYSPLGLQLSPLTGPLCPEIATNSSQCSDSLPLFRHLLQPPAQPHAIASFPSRAQKPPTKPPNLCPPISPNLCRLIHIEVVPSGDDEDTTDDGDQRIRDESVDVDKRVGIGDKFPGLSGRHDSEVIPAS